MSKNAASFTPGPWHAIDGQVFGNEPQADDEEIIVCDVAPGGIALTEYDLANAQLIAAAPDLLHALECLQEWVDNCFQEYADAEVCTIARSAIAKVRQA